MHMPPSSKFQEFVEEVRRKTDIVTLIAEDAKLEKTSGGYKCKSPLRHDNDPSFWIYAATQSWCDFGTHDGGDVFRYIEKRDRVDFRGAVEILARRAGVEAPWSRVDPLEAEAMQYLERRAVSDLLTEAIDYYHHALPDRIREECFRAQYGFSNETIDELRLGWADGHLADYFLSTRGYTREMVLSTGLFLERGTGGEIIDLYSHRLVFPYWHKGLVVYSIARRTKYTADDDWEKPKYKKQLVNGTKHPYVSSTVSNDWFWGEDSVSRRVEELLITEGVTDAISAWQVGLPVISPVTVRFRNDDIPKLLRLTERADRIILCNDADVLPDGRKPGEEGALRTATALFQAKRDVRVAALPRPAGASKVDLNEFIRDRGLRELRPILDASSRYPEFLIQQVPKDDLPIAELEARLQPVAEVVASLAPIQRELYIKAIAKRFKLPKRTVAEMIATFEPPEAMLTDEQIKQKEIEAARANLPQEERIRGRVLEELRYYYTESPNGTQEVISSFTLRATQRITLDSGEILSCEVSLANGKNINSVIFPRGAWTSRRDFLRAFPSPDMQWKGTDDHVQDVLRLVTSTPAPTRKGTTNLGFIEMPDGPRWVSPNVVISPRGVLEDPDVVFVPSGSTLAARVSYELLPDEPLRELAKAVLPELLKLNAPDVIVPIIGWFFATPFKPRLNKLLGHFPILMVWGTAGSGKTSIVKDIFWPLLGVSVRTEPYSCTETEFALMRQFAATDSVPLFLDEFKPRDMGKNKVDRLLRLLRRVYGGETEERGRVDLSVASYHLAAPIVLAGEAMPDGDPALMERMICVSPRKTHLQQHPEARAAFRTIARSQAHKLAGAFVQWSLSRDVSAELEEARTLTDRTLKDVERAGKVPLRVYDNLLAMTFGVVAFDKWGTDLGVSMPEINLTPIFKELTATILEGEGSNVKDAFDAFLESLSTYAHMGALTENVHYAMMDGKLCIHLAMCHEIYLTERRKSGREDDTNGLRALRRVIAEKVSRGGSFVLETEKRVQLEGGHLRCVVIDMNKVPSHLEFEPFPIEKDRGWGGTRPGTNGWSWDPTTARAGQSDNN
jgi:DNA primase